MCDETCVLPAVFALRHMPDYTGVLQVLRRSLVVSRATDGGSWERMGEEVVQQRMFTVQELQLLADSMGQQSPVVWYGDYDTDIGLEHEEAYRMIMVLQRQ